MQIIVDHYSFQGSWVQVLKQGRIQKTLQVIGVSANRN
jgi:hypothetical protein